MSSRPNNPVLLDDFLNWSAIRLAARSNLGEGAIRKFDEGDTSPPSTSWRQSAPPSKPPASSSPTAIAVAQQTRSKPSRAREHFDDAPLPQVRPRLPLRRTK